MKYSPEGTHNRQSGDELHQGKNKPEDSWEA